MRNALANDLFGALTSAVGGRPIFAMLWISWLLVCVLAHYTQEFIIADNVSLRSRYVFGLIAAATVYHLFVYARSISSTEGRRRFVTRRTDLPSVGASVRIAAWIIPVLAFGAAIARKILV